MHITMVKKQLANGEPCKKCQQAEDLLRRRGLWEKIDEVVWALEADGASSGMRLAAEHGIELAPFFVVAEPGGGKRVFSSVLQLINEVLSGGMPDARAANASVSSASAPGLRGVPEIAALTAELAGQAPARIVARALELFGNDAVISFSGAEDVMLIDLAAKSGQPFRVMSLDTGRLHAETYRFIDRVRRHFGIEIEVYSPSAERLEPFVRQKGLFSFYEDGHNECCGIRKVEPLRRALAGRRAWLTGQRRDQSPTRSELAVVELDRVQGRPEAPLVKFNPLAEQSLADVWAYLRENDVPYNPLHDQGFVSIGCEPCTRAVRPGEHERAGRWWWEEATQRECGLHVRK